MEKILIVEDDRAINDLIMMNLRLTGYTCLQVFDGAEAVSVFESEKPDLVLLDVLLPRGDGFFLIESNCFKNVPVIFVTACDNLSDRVRGLKMGADDYIVKPFEAVELLARVEAVLRRVNPVRSVFEAGDAVIDFNTRTAEVHGEAVELTNREFQLLEVLIKNCNLALSREKLLDLAWGYDYYGDTRTVDVHIAKLRKKLGLEEQIKTIYKMGYRLEKELRK